MPYRKGSGLLDSPVCISSGEDEEFYSPPAEINKEKAGSIPKPFGFNFTADETDVVDLTAVDDASPLTSQAAETTQSSPPVPSPHVRLIDFLSPTMSPKDIASSLKQQHGLLSKSPDSLSEDNITSSATEHISFTADTPDGDNATGSVAEPDTTRQEDTGVVAQYEVTARSPMNYNETASIRQISPPQDPDELKRAALLPLDERLTTDHNIPLQSVNKSAVVLIHKIESPGSMLKASIARGTVSVRRTKFHQSQSSPSLNVSATTTSLRTTSNLTQGYKFSPPVQVLSPEKPLNDSQASAKGISEQSPTMTFPFSPPLTRSQRRRTGSSLYRGALTDNSTKVQLFSESVSEMSVDPVASDTTISDTTTVTNASTTLVSDKTTITDTTVTEKSDSTKKARTSISESLSKSYLTR